jgi:integration host factor subunit alpha
MSFTKADLTENLFKVFGFNKREASDLVEIFFNEIKNLLATGRQLRLSGFGNFKLRDKGSRPGRNPKTGKEVPIAARRVVTFRAGQKLKARVEKYAGPDSAGKAKSK